nr:hypothetical protein [Tanacetum cinerariifolium]
LSLAKNVEKGKKGNGGGSVLDELIKEEKKAKERSNQKDYWLCEGIVVKVMSKDLADKGYYKQKGVVRKVSDKYVWESEMIESKHKLRVDQEELETVISQIGGVVRVVNGAYCRPNARLLSVNTDKFCAKVGDILLSLSDMRDEISIDEKSSWCKLREYGDESLDRMWKQDDDNGETKARTDKKGQNRGC